MKYEPKILLLLFLMLTVSVSAASPSRSTQTGQTIDVSLDQIHQVDPRPALMSVFEGPDNPGSPPDTEIAVSTNTIVTAENHKFNVFDKADGTARLEIPFLHFFPTEDIQSRRPYDPHIEYDVTNKKFIIVVAAKDTASTDGYLGLIIGNSASPTNTTDWCAIRFDLPATDDILLIDYPGMSINPTNNLLVLTANTYNSQGTWSNLDDVALGARVIKVRLSDAYACQPIPGAWITPVTTVPGSNCGGTECLAESLHPAQWLNDFSAPNLYLISHHLPAGGIGDTIYIWDIENKFNSDRPLNTTLVGYTYQKSPGIRQIGGQTFAMNNSPFISHAYYKNQTLYATQDVKNPDANTSAVVLHTFPIGAIGTSVTRKNSERDYAFQAVMLDRFNNIALGFSQTQFVDPTLNFAISLSGITNDILPIKEHEANLTNSSGMPRAGDYSDAYLDPNGIDIWMINSYGAANNRWRSKIFKVSFYPHRIFIPLITKG
jgi:hypothetical protein